MDNSTSSKKELIINELAYVHYESLRKYLASYLQAQKQSNLPSSQRASAREKLMKLTKTQFAELSTDVYDEMNRRAVNGSEIPFLPVRDEFHPKRNQARQKLATLPTQRCKDLASDVYYEIERRFPFVVDQYLSNFGENDGTLPAVFDRHAHNNHNDANASQNSNSSTQPVDFGNLDNLLNDLNPGSVDSIPSQYNRSQSDFIEKLKHEYETSIRELKSKIEKLEGQNRASQVTTKNLHEKSNDQEKIIETLTASNRRLIQENDKLREEFEGLQDDYTSQQHIANEIRLEATNLLDEIKQLSGKNEELVAENQNLGNLIKDLTNRQSKASYGNKSIDSSLPSSLPDSIRELEDECEEDGVIDQRRITAYQAAVDELLKSAQSDTPTSVLVAMKSIVISCKTITEETEQYESTITKRMTMQDKGKLVQVKNRISQALTGLMASAKAHATRYAENLPTTGSRNSLESSATQLTAGIVELVELLQIKSVRNEKGTDRKGSVKSNNVLDLVELKTFLETQTDKIVQGIQSLLLIMRQKNTGNYNKDPEFITKVSEITGIVESVVHESRSTLSMQTTDLRERGEEILKDLFVSNGKLEELVDGNKDCGSNKSVKQKLASSSYEIAKFVKELISLID